MSEIYPFDPPDYLRAVAAQWRRFADNYTHRGIYPGDRATYLRNAEEYEAAARQAETRESKP